MFYVKTKINDETTIRTKLTDENVFTTCPVCGAEQLVDLAEIFADFLNIEEESEDYIDLLETTAVYCAECSRKMCHDERISITEE